MVKYFERSQVDAAWNWLESDDDNRAAEKDTPTSRKFGNADQWERSRWYGPMIASAGLSSSSPSVGYFRQWTVVGIALVIGRLSLLS